MRSLGARKAFPNKRFQNFRFQNHLLLKDQIDHYHLKMLHHIHIKRALDGANRIHLVKQFFVEIIIWPTWLFAVLRMTDMKSFADAKSRRSIFCNNNTYKELKKKCWINPHKCLALFSTNKFEFWKSFSSLVNLFCSLFIHFCVDSNDVCEDLPLNCNCSGVHFHSVKKKL